jgi:hypothetical protein
MSHVRWSGHELLERDRIVSHFLALVVPEGSSGRASQHRIIFCRTACPTSAPGAWGLDSLTNDSLKKISAEESWHGMAEMPDEMPGDAFPSRAASFHANTLT